MAFGFEESGDRDVQRLGAGAERIFQEYWDKGNGFRFMFGTFNDIATSPEANEAAAASSGPRSARSSTTRRPRRKLTPTELYAKRPLCNEGYYETFNRDNVTLVSSRRTRSSRSPHAGCGPRTAWSTSWTCWCSPRASTRSTATTSMDLRGRDGKHINEHWGDTPTSYLGVTTARFPNMFMILGPNGPFTNLPPSIETQVEFIADVIRDTEPGRTSRRPTRRKTPGRRPATRSRT